MPSIRLPFETYSDAPSSTAKLVNCYIEQLPGDARSPAKLVRAPGLKPFGQQDTAFKVLAMYPGREYLWLAHTDTAGDFRLDALDKLRNRITWAFGALAVDISSPVTIAEGVGHVVACMPPHCYYFTLASYGSATPVVEGAPTQYGDTDFRDRGASEVAWLDNYFLYVEPNSGRFFGDPLGEVDNTSALDFATAESNPDFLRTIIADHGQLIALGDRSGEIWEATGSSGFPFQRVPNGRIEAGCLAPMSKAKLDQSVVWLADDRTVRVLDGVTPVRISTHGVEKYLTGEIGDAQGWTYTQGGHHFYVLQLPEKTFVYDATTRLWHERKSHGYKRFVASHYVNAFGKALCVDNGYSEWVSGAAVTDVAPDFISEIDPETYTQNGRPMVMEWTYQPIYADGATAFHDQLEIVLETGVGATTGQGSDPQIMLEYSDDGGKTFQHLPPQSFGARGNRQTRCIWTALGTSTQRVYRASISDPVPVAVTDTILFARGARL